MEIKAPPLTFQKLGKFIRRRISPNSQIEHLTTGEQQELVINVYSIELVVMHAPSLFLLYIL